MKRLAPIVLAGLLIWCSVAAAAPAVVQSDVATTSNTATLTVNSASLTTTAGHTLLAYLSNYINGTNTVTSVTGPGQTWTQAIAPNTGASTSSNWGAWICSNCAALSSQVITGTGAGAANQYLTLIVVDVSGVLTTGVGDLAEKGVTASTATPSFTTTGTTAQASEIAFGYMAQTTGNGTVTEAAGWTTLKDTFPTVGAAGAHLAYKILSTTGTQTYSPTTSPALRENMSIITLKASAGGAVVCRRALLGVGC